MSKLSDDELEEYPDDMKTESGYLKDGFVVYNKHMRYDIFTSSYYLLRLSLNFQLFLKSLSKYLKLLHLFS